MDNLKNVLVTGATKGLGRAIVDQLIGKGYRIVGTGRAVDQPTDWPDCKELVYKQLELANTKEHYSFVKALKRRYGPFYGLVNNAAIGLDGVLATMHERDIESVLNVNVLGTIVLTKYVLRSMLPLECGRIVNISSIIASTGFNGLSVYGASKSALHGFTRSLAREVGKANITVNSVSPGFMKTEMSSGISKEDFLRIQRRSPMDRLVLPGDPANVVEYLLSDAAHNLTGIDIKVDAGSTI